MKKFILSLAISIGLFAQVSSQTQIIAGPAISLDKKVHDFGSIAFASEGTCEFEVTNTGTEPLILQRCQTSCGCLVASCSSDPILPGESSLIKVRYDTRRVGPFHKIVTISSNATNEPTKVVQVKGIVAPDPNAPAKN